MTAAKFSILPAARILTAPKLALTAMLYSDATEKIIDTILR